MNKTKAWFVATAIVTLLGVVIWLMWSYAIRSFWVAALMFALYGFVCFGVHLERWLEAPAVKRPEEHPAGVEDAEWEGV